MDLNQLSTNAHLQWVGQKYWPVDSTNQLIRKTILQSATDTPIWGGTIPSHGILVKEVRIDMWLHSIGTYIRVSPSRSSHRFSKDEDSDPDSNADGWTWMTPRLVEQWRQWWIGLLCWWWVWQWWWQPFQSPWPWWGWQSRRCPKRHINPTM